MNTGQTVRKGPQQMLTEGFYDLTSGDTNCLLYQTIFYAEVTVSGDTQNHSFYTGTTLNDYPLDSLFYDVVKEILLSYEGIGEVFLDYLNNIITIDTNCNSNVSLIDVDVKIALKISYDIDCQSCGLPTPTPTPTPTLTPTLTPTPTPTPTPALCLTYELIATGVSSIEFLFNGCCGDLGLNSLILDNTSQSICSTTLPTTTIGGTVNLIGECPC